MLSGHAIGLHERSEPGELLLADPVSEIDEEEDELSGRVLYRASFEELAKNHIQYDTVIWILISLLLVLAWGVGVVLLLYLPIRRYILRKEISSRILCVTPKKIVYKATRPSFLPFLGFSKIEKHIPLHLIIDIIIEQGCLQAPYGIHTFRIESKAHRKASPVDELQFQGVSNPGLLRKIVIMEAMKRVEEVGYHVPSIYSGQTVSTPTPLRSLTEVPSVRRSHSLTDTARVSPQRAISDIAGAVPGDLLLHKLEEVKQMVKKIESLVLGSQEISDGC